jgi:hypothetical protein
MTWYKVRLSSCNLWSCERGADVFNVTPDVLMMLILNIKFPGT